MKVKAILWDGFKKISGHLDITKTAMSFQLSDFESTSLQLHIPFLNIENLALYHLFSIEPNGIEVIDVEGKRNVFIVDDAEQLMKELNQHFI